MSRKAGSLMGIFTYRQTKRAKQQIQKLRHETAAQARLDRDTALFQQLPLEGKEAFRELDAAFRQLGPFQLRRREDLIRAREELFRKHDLIP